MVGNEHEAATTMDRREFVQKSVLAGLAVGMTGMGLVPQAALAEEGAQEGGSGSSSEYPGYLYEAEEAEGTWISTMCTRNCYDSCLMKAKVVDGTLVQVRGDNDNPYTKGGLCVKTQNYVDYVYGEDRILYPMKRTGAKGPGCTFERISWDEAIQTITDKWKEIIAENGPEAITSFRYQGSNGAATVYAEDGLFTRMQATHHEPAMCVNGYYSCIGNVTGPTCGMDTEDIPTKDLYVSWAHNESAASLHKVKFIKEMQRNGGKIAVVNPVHIPLCDWADLWVALKPGTDIVFCYGVANYLIENDKYDADWIAEHSVGFDDYKAAAAEWTLEKTAEYCGISEQDIIDFAELIWDKRDNSCICLGMQSGRRLNGGWTSMAVALISTVLGHPESHLFLTGSSNGFSWGALSGGELAEAYPYTRWFSSPQLGQALTGVNLGEGQDFSVNPIRSFYVYNGNPMVSCPDNNLVQQGLEREDLFTVVHDIVMTPTAEYADILLPAPTFFEIEDFAGGYGHAYDGVVQKCIEPLGECKCNYEVSGLLGRAMGYTDPCFDYTPDKVREILMEGHTHTYEEYLEKGWFRADSVPTPQAMREGGYYTSDGKAHFGGEEFKAATGQDTIYNYPDNETEYGDPEKFARFPLYCVTPAAKEYLNGIFGNLPDNNILLEDNYLVMNPADAEARGIANGDAVRVFNDRGDIDRTALVVENAIAPGVVCSYKSTWTTKTGKQTSNALTTPDFEPFGHGTAFMSCLVEVAKA